MKLGKAQSLEDVAGLVGACAVTILAVIIISALYVGREVFVPVALAILLSFVLARRSTSCSPCGCRGQSRRSAPFFSPSR